MRTAPSCVSILRTDRYTVVTMPEEIDLTNAAAVREQLLRLLNGHASRALPVILDFSGTAFCDSSMVHVLVRAHTRATAMGCRLYAVVPPDGIVRRVFDATAVWRLVPMRNDIGSAIATAVVTALDEARPGDPGTRGRASAAAPADPARARRAPGAPGRRSGLGGETGPVARPWRGTGKGAGTASPGAA